MTWDMAEDTFEKSEQIQTDLREKDWMNDSGGLSAVLRNTERNCFSVPPGF
jgi:hypothetical protein